MSQGRLLKQIEEELAQMREVVSKVEEFLPYAQQVENPLIVEFHTSGLALHLHSFYLGAERIFEAIAKEFDQTLPTGDNWHKKLLKRMLVEVSNVRAPVISEQAFHQLDDLRGFRHIARSNYAHKLNPERVLELASQLPQCYQHLEQDLKQFCEFLN